MGIHHQMRGAECRPQHCRHNARGDAPHDDPVLAMHKPAEHVRRVIGRAIARADAGDLQVFLVLLGDNVHGVVEGHDTQDMTVLVADGDGNQVVLGHLVRYVFLVLVGRHIDQVAIGQLAQRGVAVGHDQRAQRKHARQHAARILGIDVVDALEVLVEFANRLDGVSRPSPWRAARQTPRS